MLLRITDIKRQRKRREVFIAPWPPYDAARPVAKQAMRIERQLEASPVQRFCADSDWHWWLVCAAHHEFVARPRYLPQH